MFDRALSSILKRGLAESPRAASLTRTLAGRRLALAVTGTPWLLVVESTGTTLQFKRGTEQTDTADSADATVSGGLISLVALAGEHAQEVIQRGDVRIEGDVEIAQQFRELALLLRPDIETLLARVLGQVPAHLLTRAARGSVTWGKQTATTAVTNVAEYLAHERGTLVPRPEAESLVRDVEQLREHIDRIDARIHALEQQSAKLAGVPEPKA